ncbi:hypothetical protein ACFX2C_021617 [Malus domestica]
MQPHSLAFTLFKARYFPSIDFLNASVQTNASFVCCSIAATRPVILKGLHCLEEVEVIQSISLSIRRMFDRQVWHYERIGIFSMKSVYYLAKREVDARTLSLNSQDSLIWKRLWYACVHGKKIIEHVLRDCSMARAICAEFLAGLTAVEEDVGLALQAELLTARRALQFAHEIVSCSS